MKRFYRQRRNNKTSATTKPRPPSKSISKKKPAPHASICILDPNEINELLLKQFDMNMTFGPCVGMTRMARWERACRLGLDPPQEIETLLKNDEKVGKDCLWNGRLFATVKLRK